MSIIKNKLKTLALLDAIIEQEWEYRYFSFNSQWSDSEEVAFLSDGEGGKWFVWFFSDKIGFKCTSQDDGLHENFEELKLSLPSSYNDFLNEPAFEMFEGTCIWYMESGDWIKNGLQVKGVFNIEEIINWTTYDYIAWATDYFEKDFNASDIELVFKNELSDELFLKINPDLDLEELKSEFKELGFAS